MTSSVDPAEVARLRAEVAEWAAANWSEELTLREWWKRLAESGWGYPTWPAAWFGKGLSGDLALVVRQELNAVGALRAPHGIGQTMGAPVLFQFGNDDQKQRFLPAIATGEASWCQFFSEPNAGSDLAGVQTRAMRDGDEWVVNGVKIWNSGTRTADRGLLVARTDSERPKHKGISFFIIPVDQPGIEVRPIKQMNGQSEFNETFFTDARVSDADRIGGVNDGWMVTLATLASERSSYVADSDYGSYVSPGERNGLLDLTVGEVKERVNARRKGHAVFPMGSAPAMVELAKEYGRVGDPVLRQRIMKMHCLAEAARFTAMRAKAAADAGRPPGPESSLGYVAGVLLARASRDLALDIVGPHGMLVGEDAPHGGGVAAMALGSLVHGIQGGTEQIQRNILGERVLGLPKEPQVDRDAPFKDLLQNATTRRG